jgi:NitT/TauT family transport system ATP-binding protein
MPNPVSVSALEADHATRADASRGGLGEDIHVSISDLSKVYSTRKGTVDALASVSLSVRAGEFVSVLGPSGCGKSTLLMIVAGLRKPTTGRVEVVGREVLSPQRDVGMVFQSPLLLEWRDAVSNVLLQVEAPGFKRSEYRERAMELLRSVRLEGFERRYPRELSGGMQQRVALCRALIHDPRLLLMDEPFGALDALTREQMMADLHKIWYRQKKTVLFVTHSIPEAVFLSDRVVVMTPRPGRIEQIVPIRLEHPRKLAIQTTPQFNDHVDQIVGIFKRWGLLQEE